MPRKCAYLPIQRLSLPHSGSVEALLTGFVATLAAHAVAKRPHQQWALSAPRSSWSAGARFPPIWPQIVGTTQQKTLPTALALLGLLRGVSWEYGGVWE